MNACAFVTQCMSLADGRTCLCALCMHKHLPVCRVLGSVCSATHKLAVAQASIFCGQHVVLMRLLSTGHCVMSDRCRGSYGEVPHTGRIQCEYHYIQLYYNSTIQYIGSARGNTTTVLVTSDTGLPSEPFFPTWDLVVAVQLGL